MNLVKGDVRNYESLARVAKTHDWILHLAAIVGYPACKKEPHVAQATNVEGTRTLLRLRKPDQKFLFASTGALITSLVFARAQLFGRAFYVHTLIGGSLLLVVGTQLAAFGLCGRAYAVYNLGDRDPWFERNGGRFRMEHGLLLGLARPTAGEALVLGAPLGDREARRHIGYLPELFRFQALLTAREVLRLHCRLLAVPKAAWEQEGHRAWRRSV